MLKFPEIRILNEQEIKQKGNIKKHSFYIVNLQ